MDNHSSATLEPELRSDRWQDQMPAPVAVLHVKPGMAEAEIERVCRAGAGHIALVSSMRVYLGDSAWREVETRGVERAKASGARVSVFRVGSVLQPESLARFSAFYPLVPRRLCGCFLRPDELAAAIEVERQTRRPVVRVFALFGVNRPWRELLAEHRRPGIATACVTAVCFVLSWLLVGQIAALLLGIARRSSNVGTLYPASFRELLEIYNPYNFRHVKVVGYNNGVNHFGHRYAGKTIVSTIRIRGTKMAGVRPLTPCPSPPMERGEQLLKADCGATVRRALDFLAPAGRELPVVPNYSYVCLGTAFFVPIHGSASDYATIAETICRAVLYDPRLDRIISVGSDEPAFRDNVYHLESSVLVLRLYLRTKQKSRYFIRKEELANPDAAVLLAALRDSSAANVEIRKAQGSASTVSLCRYYHDPAETTAPLLELPRDALGRLWDRLEENPLSSFAMHFVARRFLWHVELFFAAEDFTRFWQTHSQLAIKKIQVRYIRQDGLPNSPFRDHDCVSVDLFMLRRHQQEFEAYLTANFPGVRSNPGKHSR